MAVGVELINAGAVAVYSMNTSHYYYFEIMYL